MGSCGDCVRSTYSSFPRRPKAGSARNDRLLDNSFTFSWSTPAAPAKGLSWPRWNTVGGVIAIVRTLAARGIELTLIAMSVFFFVVATNTQTGWLYLLSAATLGIVAFGFLAPRGNIAGVDGRLELPRSGQVGQPLRVRVCLSNSSNKTRRQLLFRLPALDWEVQPRRHALLFERLAPGEEAEAGFSLRPALRGAHTLPQARLVSAAPLGFFPVTRRLDCAQECLILPSVDRLTATDFRRLSSWRAEAATTAARPGHSRELRRLRDYQPGEDPRHVHWPSSARQGRLLVREFQQPGSRRLTVALENLTSSAGPPHPDTPFEQAIATAASLLYWADRHHLPTTFCWRGPTRWSACPGSPQQSLPQLARLQADQEQSFARLLEGLDELCGNSDLKLLCCSLPEAEAWPRLAAFAALELWLFGPAAEQAEQLRRAGLEVRVL